MSRSTDGAALATGDSDLGTAWVLTHDSRGETTPVLDCAPAALAYGAAAQIGDQS